MNRTATTHRPSFPGTAAAKDLRQRATDAEAVVWDANRDRRLAGLKIRRQRPFGPFVVDFICAESRLVIEVDGPIHDEQIEQDAYRTEVITSYGFQVLRFRNSEVLNDLPSVLDQIHQAAFRPRESLLSSSNERGVGG